MRLRAAPLVRSASAPITVGVLFVVSVVAWVTLVRQSADQMSGHGSMGASGEAAMFVGMWGVMMAAMMLPSAAPMILLYGTVRSRLRSSGDRAIPALVFGGIYLVLWLLAGVPVYLASTIVETLFRSSAGFRGASPYVVALILAAAGAYQFSPLKRRCLRVCESPLSFLMRRWKSGYRATLEIAVAHGGYCLGCCWALMVILVAAGAMSLAWVLVITAIVFAEKVLPYGERTARAAGFVLIILAAAVVLNPPLSRTLRWGAGESMPEMSRP